MTEAPQDPLVSLAFLARETGLDPRTVKSILERDGTVFPVGKRYHHGEAMSAIAVGEDPSLTAGHASVGRGSVALPETARLAAAKASSEEERARKLRWDNDLRAGRFVSREEIAIQAEQIAHEARQQFLGLGSRLAHRLTNVPDQRDIKRIVDAETIDIANTFATRLAVLADTPAQPKRAA